MPKAKRPRICIDRILPWNMMKPQRTYREEGRTKAIQPFPLRTWPNGTTLHVNFMEGTVGQKAKVKEQARWWEEVANPKFVFDDAVDAEIRIAFNENDGAWSYIGTDCRSIPSSSPTMNLGFLDGGTVAHEFGHAIGLLHEHQNPEGGIE